MHAYLLIGGEEEKRRLKAIKLAEKEAAFFIENPLLKIEDVRELGKLLKLKTSQKTVFFIPNIEKSTPESLNAFLKLLEEPKINNIFVLSAQSETSILPTILSRTQIIKSENESTSDIPANEDLDRILSGNAGEKLKLMDKYKKKEDSLKFLEELIFYTHAKVVTGKDGKLKMTKKLKIFNDTFVNIRGNGNPTIQLINLGVNS